MILTITLTFASLLLINLLLLIFSCNKTTKKKKVNKQPVILTSYLDVETMNGTLAATGS